MKEKMVSLSHGVDRRRSVFKMKDAEGPRQAMELLAGRQVSQSVNVLCVCVWCEGVGVWMYVATVRWGNLESRVMGLLAGRQVSRVCGWGWGCM